MITLHTYGDSHASKHGGWDKIKIPNLNIKINWLGPKLMYSFSRDKKRIVNGVKKNDIICFCFGEIDCRCHINKFKSNWMETIDDLVKSYFETIKINVGAHEPNKVYVYNVVPPIEREHPKNLWMIGKSALPALGNDEDRKKYTNYMNNKLKEFSKINNFIFLDVYDKYVDENGFLITELSDNNCHIKNPIHIENFLIKILNENG